MRIHTQINSRYKIFDQSGRLPFGIVFGLCRRSPEDTDTRELIIDTRHSALDVPYALKHGLLTLREHNLGDEADTEVILDKLVIFDGDSTYLTLSSPVNRVRTKSKLDIFSVFHYTIAADSELASIFQTGERYTIRHASEDLGIKWYAYSTNNKLLDDLSRPSFPTGSSKLVHCKPSAGKATFKVVSSLPWPPEVSAQLQLVLTPEGAPNRANAPPGGILIRLCITNTGDQTVSLQTRGRQHFLLPWGPFQPKGPDDGIRPRAIDAPESSLPSNLKVIDAETETTVYHPASKPLFSQPKRNADQRPKLSDLVNLRPSEPFVKDADIGKVLGRLRDGKYHIKLHPQTVWWCFGGVDEIMDDGDDRVPKRLYKTTIPPLTLETEDVVTIMVENGVGCEA